MLQISGITTSCHSCMVFFCVWKTSRQKSDEITACEMCKNAPCVFISKRKEKIQSLSEVQRSCLYWHELVQMLIVCLQIHTWIQIGCLCSYAQSVVGVKLVLLNVCKGKKLFNSALYWLWAYLFVVILYPRLVLNKIELHHDFFMAHLWVSQKLLIFLMKSQHIFF